MKRILILAMLSLPLTACKPATTTQPLAPGYNSPADQTIGQTLAASRAFYASIQQDYAAGKITLTGAEKTALNDLGTAINAADASYLAYHNGQGTLSAAQSAANQVTAKQAAVQAMIPGVKP